jgi:hypothetical protein
MAHIRGSQQQITSRDAATFVMLAGILAGLMQSMLMIVARASGLWQLSFEKAYGSLLLRGDGSGAWLSGLMIHLFVSALFALLYARIFRTLGSANVSIGAGLGFAHWLVSGILMGLSPMGFFALDAGLFGFWFVMLLHLLFGSLMGVAYGRLSLDHPEMLRLVRRGS